VVTISLCIIVKNEEDTIGRCLDSVQGLVDEIIIVDTGSTDQTKHIIKKYTELIYDFEWIDDFAAARNYAFSKAKMDYIFWLDADDILLEEDQEKFKLLKQNFDYSLDAVSMNYNLQVDEDGNVISSLRRNRLVKRQNHFQWVGPVHEYLEVNGNILNSDIAVTHASIHHDSERNLRIYEIRLNRGEEFSPRDLFYYANELFDHQKYTEAISYYTRFLDSHKGWVEDNISACVSLADCFHYIDDLGREFQSLVRSFEFEAPRAEVCCRLGYYFIKKNQPVQAVFWYKLATNLEKSKNIWGRLNHACWTWLPHLMLCNCYKELGNIELAIFHNNEAARFIPEHPSINENNQILHSLLEKKKLAKKAEIWSKKTKEVDETSHILKKRRSEKFNITFILNHSNLCGGVKSVLEYSNCLVNRGHIVNIVCHDPEPQWMELDANYIQVPANIPFVECIPNTDIIITTYWRQLIDCYELNIAPVIHFEQGDTYIFEFENLEESMKEEILSHWTVPIPIIAVSKELAKQIDRKFRRKPYVIPYALNENIFFPRPKGQSRNECSIVMFVGPEQWAFKGIPDIIDSIKIVKEKGYNIEPIWVTQFTPESEFAGTVYVSPTQEQLGNLYRKADIYICGSHYESFGLPVLEAMTCGCAVVSTRNVGVMEYAEHKGNCLLTNIGDPNDLAEAIMELLDDQQKTNSLVEAGYQTAENFKMEQVIDQFEKFINGVIHCKVHS